MTETKAHAKYGASSSERWLACPGSVKLSMKAPPAKESSYAEEGTRAHACLEEFLQSKDDFLSTQKRLLKTYPKDMVGHAADAFHYITDELKRHPGAELLCETRVDLSFVKEDEFGTVDAAIVDLFGTLTVIDFKYGAGILVDPTDNTQLIYYALGIAHRYNYDFEKVRIVIVQPRAYADDGSTIRTWETSISHIEAWAETFRKGIEACEKEDAPLASGEHCKFCRAATICPELSTKALKQAQIDFDFRDVAPRKAVTFTPPERIENLHNVLECLPLIEKWIDAVRNHAQHLLEGGHEVKYWKLVPKRSTRQWLDENKVTDEAVKKFGAELVLEKPSLLSPAQLEKSLKKVTGAKDWIAANTTSVSSGLTMVHVTDPRPAVVPAKDDFDDLELDELEEFAALPDALPVVQKKKKLPKHVLAFKQSE